MLAYWIAFGPHGPRSQPPKGESLKIFFKVAQLCAVSVGVFYIIHAFAKPQPKTMSKEWQEATNEYALVCSRTEYRDLGYIFLLFYLRDRFEFVTDGFFFLL